MPLIKNNKKSFYRRLIVKGPVPLLCLSFAKQSLCVIICGRMALVTDCSFGFCSRHLFLVLLALALVNLL